MLAHNAVALAAIGGAVWLLAAGIDRGWGWLILLAFLTARLP